MVIRESSVQDVWGWEGIHANSGRPFACAFLLGEDPKKELRKCINTGKLNMGINMQAKRSSVLPMGLLPGLFSCSRSGTSISASTQSAGPSSM